ncbi:MAG: CDP-archaeol synthase [Bifidobacteriaceae bacterium]|jgi:hypothetical protein|nr:CDP-archaeol synthase [Bifidobacteriaceae bacterium]
MTWSGAVAAPYVTLMPVLVAGILNMAWVKAPVAKWLAKPIDAGRRMADGRPVLGHHKTWKGLVGMVFLGAGLAVAWGAILAHAPGLAANDRFYDVFANRPAINLVLGAAMGLVYAVFELPNSFWKRRLGVGPGQSAKGPARLGLIILDQADSVIGLVLLTAILTPLPAPTAVVWVVVGSVTHLALNALLYLAHLRRSPV